MTRSNIQFIASYALTEPLRSAEREKTRLAGLSLVAYENGIRKPASFRAEIWTDRHAERSLFTKPASDTFRFSGIARDLAGFLGPDPVIWAPHARVLSRILEDEFRACGFDFKANPVCTIQCTRDLMDAGLLKSKNHAVARLTEMPSSEQGCMNFVDQMMKRTEELTQSFVWPELLTMTKKYIADDFPHIPRVSVLKDLMAFKDGDLSLKPFFNDDEIGLFRGHSLVEEMSQAARDRHPKAIAYLEKQFSGSQDDFTPLSWTGLNTGPDFAIDRPPGCKIYPDGTIRSTSSTPFSVTSIDDRAVTAINPVEPGAHDAPRDSTASQSDGAPLKSSGTPARGDRSRDATNAGMDANHSMHDPEAPAKPGAVKTPPASMAASTSEGASRPTEPGASLLARSMASGGGSILIDDDEPDADQPLPVQDTPEKKEQSSIEDGEISVPGAQQHTSSRATGSQVRVPGQDRSPPVSNDAWKTAPAETYNEQESFRPPGQQIICMTEDSRIRKYAFPSKVPRKGVKWTRAEAKAMCEQFINGATVFDLMRDFGRSPAALMAKLYTHGIIDDTPYDKANLRTRDRSPGKSYTDPSP